MASEHETTTMSINDLPTEILQMIFGKCDDLEDLLKVSSVCHWWAEAAGSLLSQRVYCYLEPERSFKRILLKSNRKYTYFGIDWVDTKETERQILEELIGVCQKRFCVKRLDLSVSRSETLAQFFTGRQQWLHTLVELQLKISSGDYLAGCEVLLPNLELLTYDAEPRSPWNSRGTLLLDVPELRRLKVVNRMTRRSQNNALFGCLELKSCTKLENVAINGISQLDQHQVDDFGPMLRHLQVLQLSKCPSTVVMQICEKCPNLKELSVLNCQHHVGHFEQILQHLKVLRLKGCSTAVVELIYEKCPNLKELSIEDCYDLDALQISPGLFPRLENLTLKSVRTRVLFDQAAFQNLRSICLKDVSVHSALNAPQLTTFIDLSSNCSMLKMPYSQQLSVMKIAIVDLFDSWVFMEGEMRPWIPPPKANVKELYLWIYDDFNDNAEVNRISFLLHYLKGFPNLRRLTLNASSSFYLDRGFVKNLSKLESFSAHRIEMQSTDLKRLAGLKSLILSHCVINRDPDDDEEVLLTSLQYFRVKSVRVTGISGDRFPIRVNDRQVPIEIATDEDEEEGSEGELEEDEKVFSSRNFKSEFDDDD